MSFIRLYTAANTYTDYHDIWDVSIEAQSVSGANYFVQEGRSAVFTMEYDTIWETYTLDFNKWAVYRALVEIWEQYTDIDADHNPYTYTRMVFTGYLCQDSFSTKTNAHYYLQNAPMRDRTITVRVYDYLSIIMRLYGNTKITLQPGTTITVANEIARLWNMIPYSTDPSSTLGLWYRPSLNYEVHQVPGYGLVYSQVPIMTAAPATLWYAMSMVNIVFESFARVTAGDDGIYLEYLFTRRVINNDGRLHQYRRWIVEGMQYTELANEIVDNVEMTLSEIETLYDIDVSTWAAQHQYIDTVSQMTYDITQVDTEHGHYQPGDERWVLTITGQTVPITVRTLPVSDITVGYLDWLQFMCNIQMAFIYSEFGTNNWHVTNKAYNVETTPITINIASDIYDYSEEWDTAVDIVDNAYDWLEFGDGYAAAINNFMRAVNVGKISRVVRFSSNQRFEIGSKIKLPEHNDNRVIFITQVDYDINEPQRYKYEGRSL